MILRHGDIELHCEIRGQGPDVVLLHPYPSSHRFWLPVAVHLESRFRLVMPDLRGLGLSPAAGETVTMSELAEELRWMCDQLGVGRAAFVGCSIGGYVLFEFWRLCRERVKSLVLVDTKASLDTEEAREGRRKNAEETLKRGPEWAIEQMLPKLLGATTLNGRPDVVAAARETMREARAEGMAALQRGMACRNDSLEVLPQISAPTLVLGGEEDLASPAEELERMARGIPKAELKLIARAGHYAAFERPDETGRLLREFLERTAR